ncbi:MAG: cysteine hydrolase family protein [Pseudoruegeria sp.]
MTSGLLLIDFQTGFSLPGWGDRNNPEAESNAARLLSAWRTQGKPVFHVRHISTTPDSPLHANQGGTDFIPTLLPLAAEPSFDKHVNSAFIGTSLEQTLRDQDVKELVICGLTTPHCVSTSCRMAANLGFQVILAHDACAAFTGNADISWATLAPMSAEEIHISAVSHLHGEFVDAQGCDSILRRTP